MRGPTGPNPHNIMEKATQENYLAIMLESYENQLAQVEETLTKMDQHRTQLEQQRELFTRDVETLREYLGLDEETEETREASEQITLVTDEE